MANPFKRKPARREYPPSRSALKAHAESRLELAAAVTTVPHAAIRHAWRSGVAVERIAEISGLTTTEVERAITMDENPQPGTEPVGDPPFPTGDAPQGDPQPPEAAREPEASSDDGLSDEEREAQREAAERVGDLSDVADDDLSAAANKLRQDGEAELAGVYDRELESRKSED